MSRKLWILARQGLADLAGAANAEVVLLEGAWEKATRGSESAAPPQRAWFALDTLLDSRWGVIDEEATRLADLAAGSPLRLSANGCTGSEAGEFLLDSVGRVRLRPEWIEALALRYAMVRWIRVATFFRQIRPFQSDQPIEAFLTPGRDDDYALLLEQLAQKAGANLTVHWRPDDWQEPVGLAPNPWWRRWLGRFACWCNPPLPSSPERSGRTSDRPCVLLCGNPRILDPVCQAFLDRHVQVWWLYERFAVRAWLRQRRFGVGQLWCDQRPQFSLSALQPKGCSPLRKVLKRWHDRKADGNNQPDSDPLLPCRIGPLEYQGIDLGPVARQWVNRRMQWAHRRYGQWIAAVESHLTRLRPQAVILDEDATAFSRVVVATARSLGVSSWVVQHGAPYIRFGFAPLEVDYICVWDQASRRQLIQWGVPKEQIFVTGSPWQEKVRAELRRSSIRGCRFRKAFSFVWSAPAEKEKPFWILLLTTVPPRDHRPDPVGFHLTTATYAEMIRSAFAAAARMPGARLMVKLHPRAGRDRWVEKARQAFPQLPVYQKVGGSLAACLAQADCVLGCASSAGVDAVWAGWPVIQLLPEGSSELLPTEEWGFVGTARTEAEIYTLLSQVRWGRGGPDHSAVHAPFGPAGLFADRFSPGKETCSEHSDTPQEDSDGLDKPEHLELPESMLSAADRIVQTVLKTIQSARFCSNRPSSSASPLLPQNVPREEGLAVGVCKAGGTHSAEPTKGLQKMVSMSHDSTHLLNLPIPYLIPRK